MIFELPVTTPVPPVTFAVVSIAVFNAGAVISAVMLVIGVSTAGACVGASVGAGVDVTLGTSILSAVPTLITSS